jgi:hypothetical protein
MKYWTSGVDLSTFWAGSVVTVKEVKHQALDWGEGIAFVFEDRKTNSSSSYISNTPSVCDVV